MNDELIKRKFRNFFWPWLFGYDFFISFTLGPYPRGSQSYASDLARRLREKGFTVFYSEDEAPPGAELDPTLFKALKRSRILIAIINQGALLNSKWVRKEIEIFRKIRPTSSLIPVNVGNAIERYGSQADVRSWLLGNSIIYLNESEEALESGLVDKDVLARLEISPHFLKANSRIKLFLVSIASSLFLLTAWSLFQTKIAKHERTTAVMAALQGMQSQGAYAQAAARAADDPLLPETVRKNAALAVYESFPMSNVLGKLELEINELLFFSNEVHQKLLSQGFHDGLSIISLDNLDNLNKAKPETADCGDTFRSLTVQINNGGERISLFQNGESRLQIVSSKDCKGVEISLDPSQISSDEKISASKFIGRDNLLIGTDIGTIFLHNGKSLQKIHSSKMNVPILEFFINESKSLVVALYQNNVISLLNFDGKEIAPPIYLENKKPKKVIQKRWKDFFASNLEKTGVVFPVVESPLGLGDRKGIFAIAQNRKKESVTIALYRTSEDEDSIGAARLNFRGENNCPWLMWLQSDTLYNASLDSSCGPPDEDQLETIKLPIPLSPTTGVFSAGISSGVICEPESPFVIGLSSGQIVWIRYVRDVYGFWARAEIEHIEMSKNDSVTALACGPQGTVYAAYRHAGIAAYRARYKLHENLVGDANFIPVVEPEEDLTEESIDENGELKSDNGQKKEREKKREIEQEKRLDVSVVTFYGNSVLEVRSDGGELRLQNNGSNVWSQRLAAPASFTTGLHIHKIVGIMVDKSQQRVWALTSIGRLSLLDLNTGSILSTIATSFYSAAPGIDTKVSNLSLNEKGDLTFSYQTYEMSVSHSVTKITIEEVH